MEYRQIRIQKFNLNQEKNDFLCHPLTFWYDHLDENFYHSFVALILKGG